eukprot:c18669_g1_i1.p1 GENE.c18669_g1_i1~~c18669_g1_i1.p1  ORF type:complete len:238 (-),score=92.71 c18669_g1_i1:87-755(-)
MTTTIEEKKKLKIVCISDTHNDHRSIKVPEGDILIHAGDFTAYGNEEHAKDFNEWFGSLPHKHKIVVNGNHENNASFKNKTPTILSGATFLKQSETKVEGLVIFGTEFFWPCPTGNPYFTQIPENTDILICHAPVKGFVDGGNGCPSLLTYVKKIQPKLVVSGHVHSARGQVEEKLNPEQNDKTTTFVNASICGGGDGRTAVHEPIVVEIEINSPKSETATN